MALCFVMVVMFGSWTQKFDKFLESCSCRFELIGLLHVSDEDFQLSPFEDLLKMIRRRLVTSGRWSSKIVPVLLVPTSKEFAN